jgi:hypothetical protein
MPQGPSASNTVASWGVIAVYRINRREGNSRCRRSISCPLAAPLSAGSTTAISTGRPRIASSASSHVGARARTKRGATAPRSFWYCTSDTAARTSIPYVSSEELLKCRKIALRCRKNALNPEVLSTQSSLVPLRLTIQSNRGGSMSRRIRSILSLVLVSFALTAAACGNATGPSNDTTCDHSNPVTCH